MSVGSVPSGRKFVLKHFKTHTDDGGTGRILYCCKYCTIKYTCLNVTKMKNHLNNKCCGRSRASYLFASDHSLGSSSHSSSASLATTPSKSRSSTPTATGNPRTTPSKNTPSLARAGTLDAFVDHITEAEKVNA
jgi:hypothetical protein